MHVGVLSQGGETRQSEGLFKVWMIIQLRMESKEKEPSNLGSNLTAPLTDSPAHPVGDVKVYGVV